MHCALPKSAGIGRLSVPAFLRPRPFLFKLCAKKDFTCFGRWCVSNWQDNGKRRLPGSQHQGLLYLVEMDLRH